MTWSLNAQGTKEECVAAIETSTPPQDSDDAHQYERMRTILKDELGLYGDGSAGMSIAASGHAPKDGGDRSFSIWISGKAPPKAEHAKTAPHVDAELPPLTKRHR